MSGRLIRQGCNQATFEVCPCGHPVERHTERGQVGVFPCRDCDCSQYRRTSKP